MSAIVHERMLNALQRFRAPLSSEAADVGSAVASVADAPAVAAGYTALQLAVMALPAAGLASPAAAGAAAAAVRPAWLTSSPAAQRLLPKIAREETEQLNPSQQQAVTAALGRTLTLWQGPPGTGKTRTLVAFIRAAVRAVRASGRLSGPAVLATAPSNVAVDNILEGLLGERDGDGLKVVRIGPPAKARVRDESLFPSALRVIRSTKHASCILQNAGVFSLTASASFSRISVPYYPRIGGGPPLARDARLPLCAPPAGAARGCAARLRAKRAGPVPGRRPAPPGARRGGAGVPGHPRAVRRRVRDVRRRWRGPPRRVAVPRWGSGRGDAGDGARGGGAAGALRPGRAGRGFRAASADGHLPRGGRGRIEGVLAGAPRDGGSRLERRGKQQQRRRWAPRGPWAAAAGAAAG